VQGVVVPRDDSPVWVETHQTRGTINATVFATALSLLAMMATKKPVSRMKTISVRQLLRACMHA
jgi:hypothetical protein